MEGKAEKQETSSKNEEFQQSVILRLVKEHVRFSSHAVFLLD
jgi:hypothetical protein